eukprot:TRINITY_DN8922_c0_g1_i2.p1 TRINITY_DN8922_c0_g1~~TRINITY_DN8922_c0_g1_i2.p1  ORF type:complete len:161 (-),score=34.18 TRINITY_DN8922_c0_g1_i2:3-485(-)
MKRVKKNTSPSPRQKEIIQHIDPETANCWKTPSQMIFTTQEPIEATIVESPLMPEPKHYSRPILEAQTLASISLPPPQRSELQQINTSFPFGMDFTQRLPAFHFNHHASKTNGLPCLEPYNSLLLPIQEAPPTQHVFPDWFIQERHRVLGSPQNSSDKLL